MASKTVVMVIIEEKDSAVPTSSCVVHTIKKASKNFKSDLAE